MKILKILPLLFAIALLTSCKNSHDPNGDDAGGATPNTESGYEGSDDLDRHPATSDTSQIGGRTPAGSLTNDATPAANTNSSGHLTPDSNVSGEK